MNKYELLFSLCCMLLLLIVVLVSMAFFTLLERKVLGLIQNRKGPNKMGFLGITQPFNDAIKLFSKEFMFPFKANYIYYILFPSLQLMLSLLIWSVIPYLEILFYFKFSVLFMMCCLSLGVYYMMILGWSSNSNYSLLGSLRGVAQVISYEVSLFLIILSMIFLILDFNFMKFFYFQKNMWFLFILFLLAFILFSSLLAETNRSPYDFAEGESELVSGFNIEYGSGSFALIFMAEYVSILFMGMIFSLFFLGSNLFSIIFYLMMMFISFVFIWVRGTLPRYRYDKLMYLVWKIYLPISLSYLIFLLFFFVY
uniref:NADH-ubiquinone oxidoreductase chain 1 n=1 Tax=Anisocentropus maculatus TaxID=2904904 RepID=A0A9E8RT21_9NEOP|nr:NADH dehydrogenase subunit 1 [Anisocentropus maculatus]UZZ43765.1 NADH dehydrogenase subunit 1 [Anisocentropus maculatus]